MTTMAQQVEERARRALGTELDGTLSEHADTVRREADEANQVRVIVDPRDEQDRKIVFADGSALVFQGSSWDIALNGTDDRCWCWAGPGQHTDDCPLAREVAR